MWNKLFWEKHTIILIIFCIAFLISIVFHGCTISNTCVHTQGKAADVVDEEHTASPKTDITTTIPLK